MKLQKNGYLVEGFTNKKNAVSKVSKLKRENRNKLKNIRENNNIGFFERA